MPANKFAALRHRIIDMMLVDKKYATKDELCRACEEKLDLRKIGERTIDKDISDMRYDNQLGYYAPIDWDTQRRAYYYKDPNYSISRIPLNREELKSLAFAASLLEQFKEIDILDTFSGAVEKIVTGLNIRRMENDHPKLDFVEFEKSAVVIGRQFLQPLVKAISEKKAVEIRYQRFDSPKPLSHLMHPYHLKESSDRWYLIGYHDRARDICTLALDRIISVEERADVRFIDVFFNAKEYFKFSIGIFATQEEPADVKLRFTHRQANYIRTSPIHESQKVVSETKNFLTVTMKVLVTWDLMMKIMSWGPDVKVLSPKWLKDHVCERYELALKNYRPRRIN